MSGPAHAVSPPRRRAGTHLIPASRRVRNADSLSSAEGLELPQASEFSRDGLQLGISVKRAAILILPIAIAACAGGDDSRSISFLGGGDPNASQPFPSNYRSELLAFMRTYLNNPVGVHDAALAEPTQREVGGRMRYVTCLRFIAREADGSYREARERAILYVNGRLDRMIENAAEICAGAVYGPFPELEKLAR
jgi:hypothetical protein